MCAKGSVTGWFDEMRDGDSEAARALWERYFPKLVGMARHMLRPRPSAATDEEDVAASAMESFFRAAEKGRFPDLADRDDLWRLLLRMTARKVVDLRRRENRQRRGGGRVRNAADLTRPDSNCKSFDFAQMIGNEPTPEFAAIMVDECRRLLRLLNDPELAALAIAKMEGCRNREIAEEQRCAERTIERQLHLIREIWERTTRDEQ